MLLTLEFCFRIYACEGYWVESFIAFIALKDCSLARDISDRGLLIAMCPQDGRHSSLESMRRLIIIHDRSKVHVLDIMA